jgi:3-deoxy-D-manno-octulosonate 8-phosphate phosphatase (KDO 8-P phosphatase)
MNWEDVKLLCLDFDGVITDSTKWYDKDGMALKRADGRDGMGCFMVRELLGIPIYVVSNEESPITKQWCHKQHAKFRYAGCEVGKDKIVLGLTVVLNIPLDYVCFIGDDITDLCALNIVGFPVVVADSHPFLLNRGFYTTTRGGGRGAVREICDQIYFAKRASEFGGVAAPDDRGCPLQNRKHANTHECCQECYVEKNICTTSTECLQDNIKRMYERGE